MPKTRAAGNHTRKKKSRGTSAGKKNNARKGLGGEVGRTVKKKSSGTSHENQKKETKGLVSGKKDARELGARKRSQENKSKTREEGRGTGALTFVNSGPLSHPSAIKGNTRKKGTARLEAKKQEKKQKPKVA